MKTILNIKTLLLTGIITMFVSIPVMAQNANIQTNQDKKIIGVYTESNNNFYIEKGDVITEFEDGSYYINSDVNIYSIDEFNNTITVINNSNELYAFNANDLDKYYLNEQLNITMNENEEVIDCMVDNEPQVYNSEISNLQGDTATLYVNGNKYTFDNTEGSDGWIKGDKCKAITQDGKLLEVRPIPLAER